SARSVAIYTRGRKLQTGASLERRGSMRGLMMDSPLTLSAVLRHTARLHGSREVVSRLDDHSIHRYTYRDCLKRARRLGAALRSLGLEQGDRVATFAWNHHR